MELIIQVLNCDTQKEAEKEIEYYIKKGYESFMIVDSFRSHRVCVGRYATENEAEIEAKKLIDGGFITLPIILNWKDIMTPIQK